MNKMKTEFLSKSENESFARVCVAAFVTQLEPTMEDIDDIKTAVSEAVTNCIVHGYGNDKGKIVIECTLEDKKAIISVEDFGKGIEDVQQAMEPLFTSQPEEERSGMGFTVMETFMDGIKVTSQVGKGTKVVMTKEIV